MKIIGEISSNHNGSIDRIYKLIDLASDLKFHSVKFQLFKINKLFSKEILDKSKMHRDRKNGNCLKILLNRFMIIVK